MPDRIGHDHPTVETVPATLARYGGTTRPEIRLDAERSAEVGEIVRLVLDGTDYRSQVRSLGDGQRVLRGAYKTPRLARNPGSGTDFLEGWVRERDLEWGRTVLVDVIEPGYLFGLRAPGERATYTPGRPEDGLADIARDLDS